LQDGDFTLTESFAICRYLVTSTPAGEKLYPNDPKKRAIIDMHMSALNDLRMAGSRLIFGTVVGPKKFGTPPMPEFV
jgi:glutathione S-transferase